MINIRPVSDLRNKYPEIEEEVMSTGAPESYDRILIEKRRSQDDQYSSGIRPEEQVSGD